MATEDTAAPRQGLQRLGALLRYTFARQEPGAEVGAGSGAPLPRCGQRRTDGRPRRAPQVPPTPEELKKWAQDTTGAVGVGMAVGGFRQWRDERLAGG